MKKNFIFLLTISLTPCWSYGMKPNKDKTYGKQQTKFLSIDVSVPKSTNFKKRNVKIIETKKETKKTNPKSKTKEEKEEEEKTIEKKLKNLIDVCNDVENQPLNTELLDLKKEQIAENNKKNIIHQHLETPMPKAKSKKNTPGTNLTTYQQAINQKKYSDAIKILPTLHSYNDKTILNELAESIPAKISSPFTNNETWENYATEPIKKNNFQDFTLYFIDEQIKQTESAQKKQNLNAIKTHLKNVLEFDLFS